MIKVVQKVSFKYFFSDIGHQIRTLDAHKVHKICLKWALNCHKKALVAKKLPKIILTTPKSLHTKILHVISFPAFRLTLTITITFYYK